MAAPRAFRPHPEDSDTSSKNPQKPPTNSTFDFLLALFSQSPPWLRTVVVLVIFTAAGIGIYKWLSGRPQSSTAQASEQTPYPMSHGQRTDPPGSANDVPGNIAATKHISDDDEHFKWHALHEQHEPEWNIISKVDDNNFVEYKYYRDTDRCILLLRKQNGDPSFQWAREVRFGENAKSERPTSHVTDLLVETASASPQEPLNHSETHLLPVQVGCVNPHPGQFQWWWAPSSDPCWSPMYRKFADGCTHHQMFNRCYNTWDPNVVWDTCPGGPRHF